MIDIAACGRDQLRRLSGVLEEKTGIHYEEGQFEALVRRIERRMQALGLTAPDEYFSRLWMSGDGDEEFNLLVTEVTVNETYFFRQPEFLVPLRRYIDEKLSQTPFARRLAIWCAGCSIGCEPYSLAIALEEYFTRYRQAEFTIFATDLDPEVIEQARIGLYSRRQVELETTELQRRQYFEREGTEYRLKDFVKRRVEFRCANLLDPVAPHDLDVILCRNVLIYFSDRKRDEAISHFYDLLVPDGLLILSKSETLRDFDEFFTPFTVDGLYYHRKWTTDSRVEKPAIRNLRNSDRRVPDRLQPPPRIELLPDKGLKITGVLGENINLAALEQSGLLTEGVLKLISGFKTFHFDLTEVNWLNNYSLRAFRRLCQSLKQDRNLTFTFALPPAPRFLEWFRRAGFEKLGVLTCNGQGRPVAEELEISAPAAEKTAPEPVRTPPVAPPAKSPLPAPEVPLAVFEPRRRPDQARSIPLPAAVAAPAPARAAPVLINGYIDEARSGEIRDTIRRLLIGDEAALEIEFRDISFLADDLAAVLRQCQAAAGSLRFRGVDSKIRLWAERNGLELNA